MTIGDEMAIRRIVREELEAFFAARDKAKMPESCPDYPYSPSIEPLSPKYK